MLSSSSAVGALIFYWDADGIKLDPIFAGLGWATGYGLATGFATGLDFNFSVSKFAIFLTGATGYLATAFGAYLISSLTGLPTGACLMPPLDEGFWLTTLLTTGFLSYLSAILGFEDYAID